MNRPCRTGMAAALVLVLGCIAPWSAAAVDRPAVVVDLSVLDALDAPDVGGSPGWVPPLPGHRPAPPVLRTRRILAEPAETPAPPPVPKSAPAAPRSAIVWTAPVLWQRPIPVTASAYLVQQIGARPTAPIPAAPAAPGKLVGTNVDVEATADIVSALPNGDGFRMLFVDDRTALSKTGERLLDTLAARMEARTDLRLSVLAYAGGTPDTASRSRVLSLERGLAVRNYLFDRGVRGSRIDVRALGNTFVDGPAERVDLLLTD